MADELCIHCREMHPSATPYCPNTGKPLRAASGPPAATPEPPAAAMPTADTATVGNGVGYPAGANGGAGPTSDDGDKGVLDLLQQAFELYKKNAKMLLAVAAVVFLPGALVHACTRASILAPTVAMAVTIDPVTHLPTAPVAVGTVASGLNTALLSMLAAALTGLFLYGVIVPLTHGALAIATADRLAGGQATWKDAWTWMLRRLMVVLSAIIPAALLIGVGFFFLVIPGLVLAFFFAFVPTVALFEGKGGTEALRRSYALIRSDWLRMLLVMIVYGLISAVARFLAGMLSAGLFGTQFLEAALTLVVMPIPVVGAVLLYFDVRKKHDAGGFSDEQLAKEMAALRAA